MPGYGYSAPIEPYTFKGLAQSCVQLIQALQCEQVILVGHSMGGMVAQEVVARRPELVSRLVLSGTSPAFGKPDGDWQSEFVAQRTAPLTAGKSMAELAQTLVPQMVGPGSLPEGVRLATHCMGLVPAATYRRALECLVTFDRRGNLPNIRVPTLVIAGEHDRNAPPAVMKKMAGAIAHSTYIEMKGIGHLQNLEAPDEFDSLVLNFLSLPEPLLH
jgi:pimeloyl-ACP methyl ester carboxylesterase